MKMELAAGRAKGSCGHWPAVLRGTGKERKHTVLWSKAETGQCYGSSLTVGCLVDNKDKAVTLSQLQQLGTNQYNWVPPTSISPLHVSPFQLGTNLWAKCIYREGKNKLEDSSGISDVYKMALNTLNLKNWKTGPWVLNYWALKQPCWKRSRLQTPWMFMKWSSAVGESEGELGEL